MIKKVKYKLRAFEFSGMLSSISLKRNTETSVTSHPVA